MEIPRALYDALQNEGFTVQDNYSGRGMFGRDCFGVEGRMSDLIRVVQFVTQWYVENDMSELDWLADATSDSMGYDTIYYWPDVRVSEETAQVTLS